MLCSGEHLRHAPMNTCPEHSLCRQALWCHQACLHRESLGLIYMMGDVDVCGCIAWPTLNCAWRPWLSWTWSRWCGSAFRSCGHCINFSVIIKWRRLVRTYSLNHTIDLTLLAVHTDEHCQEGQSILQAAMYEHGKSYLNERYWKTHWCDGLHAIMMSWNDSSSCIVSLELSSATSL